MTFQDFGIVFTGSGEEVQTTCPQCSAKRKNSKAKCLSVNTVKGCWICHHCDWRGSLKKGEEQTGKKIFVRPNWNPMPPALELLNYFAIRGIPADTVEAEGVQLADEYLPAVDEVVPCIAFPYRKGREVLNAKYRGLRIKAFRQCKDAEKILYRQDSIEKDYVIITEGEIDCLTLVSAGYASCVSVPDGAPPANAKGYSAKFSYLDQTPDPFEGVEKIILAVDGDEPGRALEKELSRRLGLERCWTVRWPEGCKDANDTLCSDGGLAAVRACIEEALPSPVQDVMGITELLDDVLERYYNGPQRGLSTGWESVNAFYTIAPGQLTVVTGMPSSGKSEWLDALMLNLMQLHGWRFAMCSPENFPVALHLEKLTEKIVNKPFRVGPSDRMSPDELREALDYLKQQIWFLVPEEALTIRGLLDRASILVRRQGIRGLIIDPYNEFDHTRPAGKSETEYISDVLGLIKRWARQWQVHVWLVAHPTKIFPNEDGRYPVPTPYHIAGSAHFYNKPDNCLTIWRDQQDPNTEQPVEVHVQKVRYKYLGRPGLIPLSWSRRTGRYSEPMVQS